MAEQPYLLDPESRLPYARYQYVNVIFAQANVDVDIPHNLRFPNLSDPELIRYDVDKISAPAVIYNDTSPSRRPWEQTHIFLRASVPCVARILLYLEVETDTPAAPTVLPSEDPGVTGPPCGNFDRIQVPGEQDVVAEEPCDTLTLVPGTGIDIGTNPDDDTITISSTCCGDAPESYCEDLCPVYFQAWENGEGSSMTPAGWTRVPYGANPVDPLYPEIRQADSVKVVLNAGPNGENVLDSDPSAGGDYQTAGVFIELPTWDGTRGCATVWYRPTVTSFNELVGGYAPLLTLMGPMGFILDEFSINLDLFDSTTVPTLDIFYWTWDSGATTEINTRVPVLSLGDAVTTGFWQKIELQWQCASRDLAGNAAFDGWFRIFQTNYADPLNPHRTTLYEIYDIDLIMSGNGGRNDLGGVWLGFAGLYGQCTNFEILGPCGGTGRIPGGLRIDNSCDDFSTNSQQVWGRDCADETVLSVTVWPDDFEDIGFGLEVINDQYIARATHAALIEHGSLASVPFVLTELYEGLTANDDIVFATTVTTRTRMTKGLFALEGPNLTGANPGAAYNVVRNTAGNGAASSYGLQERDGVQWWIWVDNTGVPRIGSARPTESNSVSDTSGTPLGIAGGGAPNDAEYIVAAANGTLTAERVATDTPTVAWDFGTAAQAKANVPDDAITYAKMQNVSAASRLIGRGSAAGAGNPEEITLGTGLTMAGTTLSASGGATWIPLVDGAEPPAFITDGAGHLILVAYP